METSLEHLLKTRENLFEAIKTLENNDKILPGRKEERLLTLYGKLRQLDAEIDLLISDEKDEFEKRS